MTYLHWRISKFPEDIIGRKKARPCILVFPENRLPEFGSNLKNGPKAIAFFHLSPVIYPL